MTLKSDKIDDSRNKEKMKQCKKNYVVVKNVSENFECGKAKCNPKSKDLNTQIPKPSSTSKK